VRKYLLVHERPDRLLDQALLVCQLEIHGLAVYGRDRWARLPTDRAVNSGEANMAVIEERAATGVSFALTDEQRELRQLARDFAEKEIRPKAPEYDENSTHPADILEKAHELGLMNPHIPEEYGGPGVPGFDGMLIGEELSWGCAGIAVSIVANTLGSAPVMIAGTEEQKQQWLPPLNERAALCSFGLSEPNAGSDVSGIQTTAVRDGDEYVINGSQMFITNARPADWPPHLCLS